MIKAIKIDPLGSFNDKGNPYLIFDKDVDSLLNSSKGRKRINERFLSEGDKNILKMILENTPDLLRDVDILSKDFDKANLFYEAVFRQKICDCPNYGYPRQIQGSRRNVNYEQMSFFN